MRIRFPLYVEVCNVIWDCRIPQDNEIDFFLAPLTTKRSISPDIGIEPENKVGRTDMILSDSIDPVNREFVIGPHKIIMSASCHAGYSYSNTNEDRVGYNFNESTK